MNLAIQPDANIRQLCRRFNISPTAGYKWIARFKESGVEGLPDQSRRPHRSSRQTAAEVEQELVVLRKKHPAWGARKLRRRMQDLGHTGLPATSTITGILHRHGLISPEQSQASTPFKRFERSQPNELWQIDFKGYFPLKNGRCHPLCGLDDHSRYNVLLEACADQQEPTVEKRLAGAFRRYGLPDAILWDNGSPWGGGQSDFSTLDVWLMRLGVKVYHGRPYHPQTQGKEERFHRTLVAEVLQRSGWRDCSHVQEAFDRWSPIYNTQRPHDSLDLKTPVSRYRPSQRSYPESLPQPEYDSGVEVRKVDAVGWISYRGKDWKIGRAFIGQKVGLRPGSTDGTVEVIFLTQRVKELNLRQDPTRPAPTTP